MSTRPEYVRLGRTIGQKKARLDMEVLLLPLPLLALSSDDLLHDPEKVLGIPMIAVGALGLLFLLLWLPRSRNE